MWESESTRLSSRSPRVLCFPFGSSPFVSMSKFVFGLINWLVFSIDVERLEQRLLVLACVVGLDDLFGLRDLRGVLSVLSFSGVFICIFDFFVVVVVVVVVVFSADSSGCFWGLDLSGVEGNDVASFDLLFDGDTLNEIFFFNFLM